MAKKDLTIVALEADPELSLEELCETCHITPRFICELIEYGTLEPQGIALETWRLILGIYSVFNVYCVYNMTWK